jgi:spore germination cell wall hydrolase CwlJ-like protein
VFEAPKPADAQVLMALPPTETIVAATQAAPIASKAPVAAAPPAEKPVQQASLAAEPNPAEFPKSVMVTLPVPKPPLSPAQRLELQGKEYDKAEKCLAQAIYFEARNEPARGQQAVAQVVLNRVFSPYYPKDVCSVVYQNAHRHLSCQFTFACDGKPESVNEHGAWARASRIATQTLNAKVWLPEVDKATHYHAAYVRPNWIRDMKVMVRYGLHTFYRPRNWGDGSNEAHWATPANTVKSTTAAAKPAATPANKKVASRRT